MSSITKILALFLVLGGSLSACGETTEPPSSEELESIRNHHALDGSESGLFSITALPSDLAYPKGKVSLVADPKDSVRGQIAVMLINDTNSSVSERDVSFDAVEEVKMGDHWERCQPFQSGCGDEHVPKSLLPGQVLVLRSIDPQVGDVAGEIRFVLRGRELVSQTLRGKYLSKGWESSGRDYGANPGIGEDIRYGLKEGNWARCFIAKTPEEIDAALALERAYDASRSSRHYAGEWLASLQGRTLTEEERKCADLMVRLLSENWDQSLNERSRLQRCIGALDSSRSVSHVDYGTPEKCRGLVWRYMNGTRRTRSEVLYLTSEQRAEYKHRMKSGNPWGATRAQLVMLLREAGNSIAHGDPGEQDAAVEFLCFDWWPRDLMTDKRLNGLLKSSSPFNCLWPIQELTVRGQREKAVEWLLENHGRLKGNTANLWFCTLVGLKTPLSGPDYRLFDLLLHENFDAAESFLTIQFDWKQKGVPDWSGKFRESLRIALEAELRERRVLGPDVPPFDEAGHLLARAPSENAKTQDLYHLGTAIDSLAAWQNPEDTELIRRFLSHPGAMYTTADRKDTIRYYQARIRAAAVLAKREGKDAANGAILEEPLVQSP